MTKQKLIALLESALSSANCGDDELLDRAIIELCEGREERIITEAEQRLWNEAKVIKGGYQYEGVCSSQLCFPLRDGGELRLMFCEADDGDGKPSDTRMHIDFYDGKLPPGITGPAWKTGS